VPATTARHDKTVLCVSCQTLSELSLKTVWQSLNTSEQLAVLWHDSITVMLNYAKNSDVIMTAIDHLHLVVFSEEVSVKSYATVHSVFTVHFAWHTMLLRVGGRAASRTACVAAVNRQTPMCVDVNNAYNTNNSH